MDLDYTEGYGYHFESGKSATAGGQRCCRHGVRAQRIGPDGVPSIAAVENDLVGARTRPARRWTGRRGRTVTSGGTESCMLAVLGARERYRRRGGQERTHDAVADHGALGIPKGAWLFDVDIIDIPVDADFKADAEAMIAAMDDRTALAVVSAPSYAHGVIDLVEQVAAAAAEQDILCHLDLCIGLGASVHPRGRRPPAGGHEHPRRHIGLDGPAQVRVRTQGVSILLHATPELRAYHYFADAGWPGYPLINNTLLSSRSAGPGRRPGPCCTCSAARACGNWR